MTAGSIPDHAMRTIAFVLPDGTIRQITKCRFDHVKQQLVPAGTTLLGITEQSPDAHPKRNAVDVKTGKVIDKPASA